MIKDRVCVCLCVCLELWVDWKAQDVSLFCLCVSCVLCECGCYIAKISKPKSRN